MAERVGQRTQDCPVLTCIAGRECRPVCHLYAAFGVHINRGFFRIGGGRKNDIGTVGPVVAVGADVDNESAGRDVEFIRTEQKQDIETTGRHLGGIEPARTGHQAEVERRHPRGRAVQYREAVPAVFNSAKLNRRFCRKRCDRAAILAGKSAGAHQNERTFGCFQCIGEFAVADFGQRLRPCAEIIIVISKIGFLADQADREISHAPALADPRIEDGRLAARV